MKLGLPMDHPSLLVWDVHYSHRCSEILEYLTFNNVLVAFIPANTTDLLQPMDVAVNRPFKSALRDQFTHWYSEQLVLEMNGGLMNGGMIGGGMNGRVNEEKSDVMDDRVDDGLNGRVVEEKSDEIDGRESDGMSGRVNEEMYENVMRMECDENGDGRIGNVMGNKRVVVSLTLSRVKIPHVSWVKNAWMHVVDGGHILNGFQRVLDRDWRGWREEDDEELILNEM